jgi:hypothetical protein
MNSIPGQFLSDVPLYFYGDSKTNGSKIEIENLKGSVKLQLISRTPRGERDDCNASMQEAGEILHKLYNQDVQNVIFFAQLVYSGYDASKLSSSQQLLES